LNQLQVNSSTGKLLPPTDNAHAQDAMLTEVADFFKSGKITEGRQQLLQYLSLNPSRIEDIYAWMYRNLELWGKTTEQRDAAIVTIRNGLRDLSFMGIPEIALAATLVELTQ
jgi:hypothetical protein